MKTLDRTRSYGTINGDQQGRVFEQDGKFFCADGSEWGVTKKEVTEEPAADSQVDAQLAEVTEVKPVVEKAKPKAKTAAKKPKAKK